ncbi:MAG: response regulator [Bacteroidia bacterium]
MKKVKNACIIDDDEIFRFILKKHIKNQNLADNILCFENGREAIEYIKTNRLENDNLPDVIFLDINMPIMDGWDFVMEYNELKKQIIKDATVFMISSSVDDRDISRANDSGVITEYVAKPVDKKQIHDLMNKDYVLT